MKQVVCNTDCVVAGHYFRAGSSYTVDDDVESSYLDVVAEGLKSTTDVLHERLKVSGMNEAVVKAHWARNHCNTPEQKLEALEKMIADRDRKAYEHKQKKAPGKE